MKVVIFHQKNMSIRDLIEMKFNTTTLSIQDVNILKHYLMYDPSLCEKLKPIIIVKYFHDKDEVLAPLILFLAEKECLNACKRFQSCDD
jgi:hypothetical protein